MNETTGAQEVLWDLGDLYKGPEDPQLQQDLQGTLERAQGLADHYRGRVASLSRGAAELRGLLQEYESVLETSGRAASFAYLAWSTHTEVPARGALLQKLQEHSSQLQQRLLFFELEWAALAEDQAQALMEAPELDHYRFWLLLTRRYRPHLLSEPEEKILAEKAVTGRAAWVRFFEELHGAARYALDGESLPEQTVLSRLLDVNREVRRKAAEALTAGLKSVSRLSTYVLNNILADKASDDRLRRYPSWISARNLGNQIDDATVDALIAAVTGRYDVVARYYRLKKKLLGLEELYDYDRYAPLPAADRSYTWKEAEALVLDSYREFHPRLGEIAEQFFRRGWIDAAVRPGKRGGAYSHGTVPSVHPYIFLNFQGTPRDVMTLAHEMGHGVHQYLARDRGILLADTPLTTAETASVFGEMLVFQRLMRRERDPRVRLSMFVQKIEDGFATVFRQVAMNRFEQAVHEARRSEGELPAGGFGALWRETQSAMFQGSVTLTENYDIWWSYIPHFIHSPGYVYAYAFGELLVLALYARYRETGSSFPAAYLELLSAGGSNWPHELVAPLGVDLKDPGFWDKGLDMIEALVEEAERLAAGGAASRGIRSQRSAKSSSSR
jgi:oligoendopeptidase F